MNVRKVIDKNFVEISCSTFFVCQKSVYECTRTRTCSFDILHLFSTAAERDTQITSER